MIIDDPAQPARPGDRERVLKWFAATRQPFDWSQDLSEADLDARFVRASGDVVCAICGRPYWRHPLEPRLLSGLDNQPWLHQICDGSLAHL